MITRYIHPPLKNYFRITLYVYLRLLLLRLPFPPRFSAANICGSIDTRRCRSNRFRRRLVRYIPDAITGSAICHAATPADISEYPPVIMRLFVKFTREDQSLAIESRYPAADKKMGDIFRQSVSNIPPPLRDTFDTFFK